mmetsp:Transcript_13542/g.17182  ORF Transcript_13542/g.17182 Transcript_13542/m.17182 type:complete len:80 (-) Transcript_13542:87-326(-)
MMQRQRMRQSSPQSMSRKRSKDEMASVNCLHYFSCLKQSSLRDAWGRGALSIKQKDVSLHEARWDGCRLVDKDAIGLYF